MSSPRRAVLLFCQLLTVGLMGAMLPATAPAQFSGSEPLERSVQVGPAVLPGFGLQASYVQPRSFYTTESAFYANVFPPFMGGENSLLISGGFGGSLRILGGLTALEMANYGGYQLDLGLRFGPALRFVLGDETRTQKNTRVRLFLEPFTRFTWQVEGGRTLFAEIGTHDPFLRAGFWLSL